MDKATARALNSAIQAAIKPILAEHGMELDSCNARFDSTTFNLSVKSSDPTAPIDSYDLIAVGLPEGTPAGTMFRYGPHVYTFKGVNLRAAKYPIIAERDDGKSYKLPQSASTNIRDALKEVTDG